LIEYRGVDKQAGLSCISNASRRHAGAPTTFCTCPCVCRAL